MKCTFHGIVISLLLSSFIYAFQSYQLYDSKILTSDKPNRHHSEVDLKVDPTNPNKLILGVNVMEDSTHHWVDIMYSNDRGKNWGRFSVPNSRNYDSIDPWVSISPTGKVFVSVLATAYNNEGRNYNGVKVYKQDSMDESSWKKISFLDIGKGQENIPQNGWSYDQPKIFAGKSTNSKDERIYIYGEKWGNRTKYNNARHELSFDILDANSGKIISRKSLSKGNINSQAFAPVQLRNGTIILGQFDYLPIQGNELLGLVWTRKYYGDDNFEDFNLVTKNKSFGMSSLIVDSVSHPDKDVLHYTGVVGDTVLVSFTSENEGERWSNAQEIIKIPGANQFVNIGSAIDGKGTVGHLWTNSLSQTRERQCNMVYFSYKASEESDYATVEVLDKPYCIDLPGEDVFWAMRDDYSSINGRFGRGGEYLGLVGYPKGGFYAIWVETVDDKLHLKGAEIKPEQ